jgi:hypothetical protein
MWQREFAEHFSGRQQRAAEEEEVRRGRWMMRAQTD